MGRYETAVFVLFIAVFLPTFATYHFMVFRVNQHLEQDEKIPHSTSFLTWHRLGPIYTTQYPPSPLYRLTTQSAIVLLLLAVAMVVLRAWEYSAGRM